MARVPAALPILAALLLIPAAGPAPAPADDNKPTPPPAPAEPLQRILYPARGLSPKDLARALQEHFAGKIQTVPTDRMVLLNVPASLAADVTRTLEALDRPPAMIEVEVVLAEVRLEAGAAPGDTPAASADKLLQDLPAWRKSGRLVSSHRVRLTALENQKASVQTGEARPYSVSAPAPVPAAGAGGRFGGGFIAPRGIITYRDVGMMVTVTPLLQGDQAVLDLDVKNSTLRPQEPPADGAANGAGVPVAPDFTTAQYQSRVRLPLGRPVLLCGIRTEFSARDTQTLMIATARLLPAPGAPVKDQ